MEKRMTGPCKFRAAEEDGRKHISGYFIVFDDVYHMPDGSEERIDRHAVDDSMGGDIRCLTDHDTRLVLGRTGAGTMTLSVDDHGVYGDVVINDMDTDAVNTWARVQRGDVSQASFGFEIVRQRAEQNEKGRARWVVEKLNLFEVSVCTFPAYESTQLQARQAAAIEANRSALDAWKNIVTRRLKQCRH